MDRWIGGTTTMIIKQQQQRASTANSNPSKRVKRVLDIIFS